MAQADPSTNRPLSDWLPDDAWIPIADPSLADQRLAIEQHLGRDLASITDRLAPRPYAEAVMSTVGLHANGPSHDNLENPRHVDLKPIRSDDRAAHRRAVESISPSGDPPLLIAVSPNVHTLILLPMTWRGYLEHLTPLSAWGIAIDGSWLFLAHPNDSAVSGRPRPNVIHSISHIENYRANRDAVVPFERLVIRHGHDQCWESMRIGYGGDRDMNHAFAGALSWLTGVPIEHHPLDPRDPTQYTR